jgi:hypothetical protein
MGIVNRIVAAMVSRMTKEEKQRLIGEMSERFLTGMTVEDKQKILGDIMAKFLDGMTTEDKKKLMSGITPRLMEGFDMTVVMPQMLLAMAGLAQRQEGMPGAMPMMVNITGRARKSPPEQDSGGQVADGSADAAGPESQSRSGPEEPEEVGNDRDRK